MSLVTEETLPKTLAEYKQLLLDKNEQGLFPCVSETRDCLYRSHSGKTACVVGYLMPDEKYDCRLDDLGGTPVQEVTDLIVIPVDVSIGQLCQLQALHDSLSVAPTWNKDIFEIGVNAILG